MKKLDSKSDEELVEMASDMGESNPMVIDAVDRLLQLREGKRQVEATNALVQATRALFFVGAATVMLTIVQVLVSLGIIHR